MVVGVDLKCAAIVNVGHIVAIRMALLRGYVGSHTVFALFTVSLQTLVAEVSLRSLLMTCRVICQHRTNRGTYHCTGYPVAVCRTRYLVPDNTTDNASDKHSA